MKLLINKQVIYRIINQVRVKVINNQNKFNKAVNQYNNHQNHQNFNNHKKVI